MRINRAPLGEAPRERVVEPGDLVFSWGVLSDISDGRQRSCRARVSAGGREIWDSGEVETAEQEISYAGPELPTGERLLLSVEMTDETGQRSEPWRGDFFVAPPISGKWLTSGGDEQSAALYFRGEFFLEKEVRSACLCVCGLGYGEAYINGARADAAELDPAHTDYSLICQYAVLPEMQGLIRPGWNCLGAIAAEGWRHTEALDKHMSRKLDYAGRTQLMMTLIVKFADGEERAISTGEGWQCGRGAITRAQLFDGATYDARAARADWCLPGFAGFPEAAPCEGPGGRMAPMLIPPIAERARYGAKSRFMARPGAWIYDFGQNIAGVVEIRLPRLPRGAKIAIRHMELLDDDGLLYLPNLRNAKQLDEYVYAGDGSDLEVWRPSFTYHGFRYAEVEGALLPLADIEAVALYTGLDKASSFTCGSALASKIQQNIVMTERANMHSILTDCPQRDERMGWMNDATVRFEETPYNFECAAMFKKIVRDLRAGQSSDGAITCTVPFAFGSRPADPVCSSYLVAVKEAYMHFGDAELARESLPGLESWENCLLGHSEGYIVNYSYYGDWAGPAYACEGEDGAKSAVTPGNYMSTGYSYFNCETIAFLAEALGEKERAEYWRGVAEKVASAMLAKWYDPASGRLGTDSQACIAFALWLGLIKGEEATRAAARLRGDIIKGGYRITTGNLCTRYLMDVLTDYGYVDEAWALLTREEYPSFGFEIQNEATTIWERFELKKASGMNSHNHPMYGAVGYWFYAYLIGARPLKPGWTEFEIAPRMPDKLLSASATIATPRGEICARWIKRYGKAHLYVDAPFGTRASIKFRGRELSVGSGFYHIEEAL